jgi:hypothetical protein
MSWVEKNSAELVASSEAANEIAEALDESPDAGGSSRDHL